MNSIQIQRQLLVDGEMSHQQRSDFLQQVETTGDWRELALAFLEKQTLDQALSAGLDGWGGSNSNEPTVEIKPVSRKANSETPTSRPGGRRMGIVGGVLAGVICGMLGGWWFLPKSSVTTTIAKVNPPAMTAPGHQLADAISRSRVAIPVEFRRELLKAGYVVSENEKTEEVELPVGGTIEIPVRNVKVEFLGMDAYQ